MERHPQASRFTRPQIALGHHTRAVGNQPSRLGVENLIANAESLGGAPGLGRNVADSELDMPHPTVRIKLDGRVEVAGVHE